VVEVERGPVWVSAPAQSNPTRRERIMKISGRLKERDLPVNEMWGLDYYLPDD